MCTCATLLWVWLYVLLSVFESMCLPGGEEGQVLGLWVYVPAPCMRVSVCLCVVAGVCGQKGPGICVCVCVCKSCVCV